MRIAVVALGGNAILKSDEKGTFRQQLKNIEKTVKQLRTLIKASPGSNRGIGTSL